MTSSIFSPSPFEIPHIENAKLKKLEIKLFLHNIVYNYSKPLSFENEPYTLETISLIREHLDSYLLYIRHRSTTASTEYPSFQILFLNKKHPQLEHIEENLNQSIFKFLFKKFSMLS